MGALLPVSQLHHVSERYSFLPQFLFCSSIARINILPYILPYIGAGAQHLIPQNSHAGGGWLVDDILRIAIRS